MEDGAHVAALLQLAPFLFQHKYHRTFQGHAGQVSDPAAAGLAQFHCRKIAAFVLRDLALHHREGFLLVAQALLADALHCLSSAIHQAVARGEVLRDRALLLVLTTSRGNNLIRIR